MMRHPLTYLTMIYLESIKKLTKKLEQIISTSKDIISFFEIKNRTVEKEINIIIEKQKDYTQNSSTSNEDDEFVKCHKYLHSLGLYNSVKWMLDRVGLTNFYERKDPIYVRLTLVFLSSLSYTTHLMTSSFVGSVRFIMFHKEYTNDQNAIADLLHFPYGEGVVCETPLDTD